jgi:GT2 family glycosyltransferase
VFAALFLRGDYWGLTRSSPTTTTETDWVSGACIITKKKYYESLSGFDEKIFMYMDEIDLLYRAKKKGYRVFFYPEARFTHLGSASSGNRTYPILQVYRGFLYFYKKHHSAVAMFFLKGMLQLKSLIAIAIGKLTNNSYLVSTYEEATKLVSMDR